MKLLKVGFLIIVLNLLFSGAALAKAEVPNPVGDIYVQDFANVLNPEQKSNMISLAKSLEKSTSAQVGVLIVDSIGDSTIEEFSNEAFNKFKLGDKEKNNGVLFVLSVQDKKMRIEVGYGLEGRIPDGKAGRILDEKAVPSLEKGEIGKAVYDTYFELVNVTTSEYTTENGNLEENSSPPINPLIIVIIVIVLVIVIILDILFFGGLLTQLFFLILSSISNSSSNGGGGSSGGGGASR